MGEKQGKPGDSYTRAERDQERQVRTNGWGTLSAKSLNLVVWAGSLLGSYRVPLYAD